MPTIKKKIGVKLIQMLSVNNFLRGGYKDITTSQNLIKMAINKNKDSNNKQSKYIIGIGAEVNMHSEMTYDNKEISKTYSLGNQVITEEASPNTKISFAQVSIRSPYIEKTISLDYIKTSSKQTYTYKPYLPPMFQKILNIIGKKESFMITIKAKTKYIESRGICPIIVETNRKITPAAPLKIMLNGGTIIRNKKTYTIKEPIILKKEFSDYEAIKLVGVITGTDLPINKELPVLHLHSLKYGHILNIGDLKDASITITPIKEINICSLNSNNKTKLEIQKIKLQKKEKPNKNNNIQKQNNIVSWKKKINWQRERDFLQKKIKNIL